MISSITNNQQLYKPYQPAFRGNLPARPALYSEKSVRSVEFAGRKLINRFMDLFNKKQNKALADTLDKVDSNSPEYIKVISNIGRLFASHKPLEMNVESGRLNKIAASGKPHIFIMNHDNQSKDPKMLALFNTILCDEYAKTGQAATCPRPKIILNEDILLSMNKTNRKIFKKIGAVPVDASLNSQDKQSNTREMFSLMRDFIKGKVNIFIFPEGKLSIKKNAPLKEKFQTGIAEMVTKLTDKIGEVNVTPIGFAYNNKLKSAGDSIYIGETVVFKKDGEHIISSSGNISSELANPHYKQFFNSKEQAILTDKGIPVKGRERADYVGGVLCENLRICKEEAKTQLPKSNTNDVIIEY